MSRRQEPDRSTLPPVEPVQAELQQSKAFEDREQTGPPGADYVLQPDGTGARQVRDGDRTPANDTHWGDEEGRRAK